VLAPAACIHYHFAGPAGVLPIVALATLTLPGRPDSHPYPLRPGYRGVRLLRWSLQVHDVLSVKVIGQIYAPLGEWLLQSAASYVRSAPPLAISFFVFELCTTSSTCAWHAPIKNPLHFGLSVFSASLVAGPIKRYQPSFLSLQKASSVVRRPQVASGLVRVPAVSSRRD